MSILQKIIESRTIDKFWVNPDTDQLITDVDEHADHEHQTEDRAWVRGGLSSHDDGYYLSTTFGKRELARAILWLFKNYSDATSVRYDIYNPDASTKEWKEMDRQEALRFARTYKNSLAENSDNTLTLWHGGRNLESSYHEFAPHKGGRWEHGPGLYLTNHYDIAARYAKGGNKLYKVTIRQGRDSDDVQIPFDDVSDFAKRLIKGKARKEFLEMCQTNMQRRGLSGVPAKVVSTLALNLEAIQNSNTGELRRFLVDHGADYTFVQNYHGGASVYVIHNPRVIKRVEIIKGSDVKDDFELPAQFNESQTYPEEIQQFLSSLVPTDIGKEEFGPYIVCFEGFNEECFLHYQERLSLPSSDPRHLSGQADLVKEMLDGWLHELKAAGVNASLGETGWIYDDEIFYAIFHKADALTERAFGKNIYDTLYTKVYDLLMKPNQTGDMRPLVDLVKDVVRSFEQNGVTIDISIRDGVKSSSGTVYNKKLVDGNPVVRMHFEFPTVGAISTWMWGGEITEMYAKKYAAEIAGTVAHEFVHYTQQVSRDKKSFKQKPVEPNRRENYTAYLSNPDEIAAYGEGAAQEFLHMAGGDVTKAKKKLKMFPRDSTYYKYYDVHVKQQNPEAWKKFIATVVKYLDANISVA